MSRIMGIDYGQKRIGIAISDELKIFAKPLLTIINDKDEDVTKQIEELVKRESIAKIVVGLPLHPDGNPSEQTKIVERFILRLRQHINTPIFTFDERYSSTDAHEILKRNHLSIRKSKEKVDQIAAAIILQNYLNTVEE